MDKLIEVVIIDGVMHKTDNYRGYDLWAWDMWVHCDRSLEFDDYEELTQFEIDQWANKCPICYSKSNIIA